jgi:hypothetical protein
MSDVVNLCGPPIDLDGDLGLELVVVCALFAENLMDESTIRKKYRFDDDTWAKLGGDEVLIKAVETERTRRIRDGSSARERAQILFAETPAVLGTILHGDDVNPRHRIESARELRAIAATGPEIAPAADRFIIRIDLTAGGGDVLEFNKSTTIDVNDVDPHHPDADTAPGGVVAAIAMNKTKGGGDGEPL